MELALNDDQALFHETTVRFIETELPVERTRLLHADPIGFDRGWLQKAAELGWFTMLVPEADGGGSVSGQGLIDATLIAEELGRFVQPGPFIPMNVVAAAIAAEGSEAQREVLPAIMAGEHIATWAFAAGDGNWDRGAGLQATPTGEGFELTGRRGFVQDASAADTLLVVAELDGSPVQLLVPTSAPGITVTPLECLDLSRRLTHVDFESVTVDSGALLGEIPGTADALERQLQIALALVVAETVGAIDALFTMTVQYAKDRVAFGRPIGSFQSLKHIMADDAMYLEACKAGAVSVARCVQDRTDDAGEIASMVAAYVGDSADQIAQDCLQIHGGIGYTWEHDLHLFMRRIRTNAVLYGEPAWHRERLCAYNGLGTATAVGS